MRPMASPPHGVRGLRRSYRPALRRSCKPALRGARGYTLIEVVVAFGLLAFALTLLLGSLSNGSRQIRGANEAGRAALHAQTLMDQIGVGEGLAPGRRNGELDGGRYRWELETAPYLDPGAPQRPGELIGAPQLMEVRLVVSWREGGPRERLQIDTLRLVTPTDPNLTGQR
jgi:general secretion pathway protein I